MSSRRAPFVPALCLVAAVGCHGAKGPAGPGGQKAATLESTLPAETRAIVSISAEKIRATKLWEQFGPMLLEQGKDVLGEIKKECGIDPVNDAVSFAAAWRNVEDGRAGVMLVKGKWTEDSVNQCLASMVQKKLGQKLTARKEGVMTVYTPQGESPVYADWVARDTVMVSTDMKNKSRLEEAIYGARLETNADFLELMNKTDRSATLWGAVYVPETADTTSQIGAKAEAVYFSANVTRALSAHVGIRFASPDLAKQVSAKITQELDGQRSDPNFGQYLSGVRIAPDGRDCVVSIDLNEQQLDHLVTWFSQNLLPLLGGM